jgi:4-diphosphocytidyl-2-methyl-D-erithritol synthase
MSIKKFNAILLAAGLSSRFNSEVPKQYLYFGKKTNSKSQNPSKL